MFILSKRMWAVIFTVLVVMGINRLVAQPDRIVVPTPGSGGSTTTGVPTTRQIITGYGLIGGGNLSIDRTLRLDTSGAKASAARTGLLSNTDWIAFNAKLSAASLAVDTTQTIWSWNGSTIKIPSSRLAYLDKANPFTQPNTFDGIFANGIALGAGWIQEPTNPVIALGTEPSVIQTGSQLDMWYRDYPASPDTLRYTYSTDNDMRIWTSPQIITSGGSPLRGYYLTVTKVGTNYYSFLVRGDTAMYMYRSADKVTWTAMNSGNPVFIHSSDPTNGLYYIFNTAVHVSGSTWHLWIDGSTSSYAYKEYYSYSDTVSLNWNTHVSSSPIATNWGAFSVVPVPDRNSLLIVHQYLSGHRGPDNLEQIGCAYISLADDLSLSASYHNAPRFPILYKGGVHITDPSLVSVTGKKYNLLLSYNYNQISVCQAYDSLTVNEFYDLVTTSPTTYFDQKISTSSQVQVGGLAVIHRAHFYDSLDVEGALNVYGNWTSIPTDLASNSLLSNSDIFLSSTGTSGSKMWLTGNANQGIIGHNEYWNGSIMKSLDTSKASYQFILQDGGAFDGWKIQRAFKGNAGALVWKNLIYQDTSGNTTISGTGTFGSNVIVTSGYARADSFYMGTSPVLSPTYHSGLAASALGNVTLGTITLASPSYYAIAGNKNNLIFYVSGGPFSTKGGSVVLYGGATVAKGFVGIYYGNQDSTTTNLSTSGFSVNRLADGTTTQMFKIDNLGRFYNRTTIFTDSTQGWGFGSPPTTSQLILGKNVPNRVNLLDLQSGTGVSREKTDSSGNKTIGGTLAIGGGSILSKFITASLVYNCGSIAAGVDSSFTITATGAIAGNPVQVGLSVAAEAGLIIRAECTTNDVVTVRIYNNFLVSAIDPASRTFKVLVTNF